MSSKVVHGSGFRWHHKWFMNLEARLGHKWNGPNDREEDYGRLRKGRGRGISFRTGDEDKKGPTVCGGGA